MFVAQNLNSIYLTSCIMFPVPGFRSTLHYEWRSAGGHCCRFQESGRWGRSCSRERREGCILTQSWGTWHDRVWNDPWICGASTGDRSIPQFVWGHASQDPDHTTQCTGSTVPGSLQHGQGQFSSCHILCFLCQTYTMCVITPSSFICFHPNLWMIRSSLEFSHMLTD